MRLIVTKPKGEFKATAKASTPALEKKITKEVKEVKAVASEAKAAIEKNLVETMEAVEYAEKEIQKEVKEIQEENEKASGRAGETHKGNFSASAKAKADTEGLKTDLDFKAG